MKSPTSRSNRRRVVFATLVFICGFFCGTVRGTSGGADGADLSIRGNGRHPLSLTLVWYDTYRLLPGSFESMAREVIRIYEEVGVDVMWEFGRECYIDVVDPDPFRVDVVLLPSHPTSWGLKATAMGVATHREGARGSVYVFFPALTRTLRLSPQIGDFLHPRAQKMVSRAMARIISHELLHVMAPQHPHTKSGLMNGHMSKRYMEGPIVHLDDVSAGVLRSEMIGKAPQSAVASSKRGVEDKKAVGEGSGTLQ